MPSGTLRPMRLLPIILLLLLLGYPVMGMATVPAHDPKTERGLVVRGQQTPEAAASSGAWKRGDGLLQATGMAAKAQGFWIFGGQGGAESDGLFRARLKGHRKLDMTFLVRADSAGGGRIHRGVGLRIQRGWVSLVAIDGDKATDLTPPRKLGWVNRRKQLEVVVYALGPHLLAGLFEAPKGRAILALSAGGLKASRGRAGLLLGKRHDPRAKIVLTSVRKACEGLAPTKINWRPHIIAQVAAARAKEAAASGTVLEQLPGDAARIAVRASPAGVEHLFCGGGVYTLSTRIPWKYFDLDYLKSRKAKLPLDKPGYPVHKAYLESAQVATLLKALRKRHKDDALLKVLGKTHQGRPLYALGVGKAIRKNPHRPAMLVIGAHHGNEPLSVLFVLDAAQRLLEGAASGDVQASRWLEKLNIWFVPLVNPDGLDTFLLRERFGGRKNGRNRHPLTDENMRNGVDLNRNYPFKWNTGTGRSSSGDPLSLYYRGPEAGSEPETRAIMDLTLRERFVGMLTFHTGTVALLAPYTIDGVQNPDPNEAWLVGDHLVKELPQHPQGKPWLVRRNLYSVDGTDQDWHRFATGSVALLVEGARWSPRKERHRLKVIKAMRPLWARLFDRFLDGPSLSGKVLDSEGAPVKAEVRLKELAPLEGERWTTRPRDGTFHRFLPEAGEYTVVVKTADGRSATRKVKVGKGRVVVEIRLGASRPPAQAP